MDKVLNDKLERIKELIFSGQGDTCENAAERLLGLRENSHCKNITLSCGDSGIALALLRIYEETKEITLLHRIAEIVQALPDKSEIINLNYGICGPLLAKLYYFLLTKDTKMIPSLNAGVENLLGSLYLPEGRFYSRPGMNEGTTGIVLFLWGIQPFIREAALIEKTIESIWLYEEHQLTLDPTITTLNEMLAIREVIRREATDLLLSRTAEASIKRIRKRCKEANKRDDLNSLNQSQRVIIDLIKQLKQFPVPAFIRLDTGKIAENQIAPYFTRSLKEVTFNVPFQNFYHPDGTSTISNFIEHIEKERNSFSPVFLGLFGFEKNKFLFEQELREKPLAHYLEVERASVNAALSIITLPDRELENRKFTISDHIKLVEASFYYSFEPELRISESDQHTIILKAKIRKEGIYLTETCLEGTYKLLSSLIKYGKPVTTSQLLEQKKRSEDYSEEYYKRFINMIRQMTMRRFLKFID